MKLVLKVLGIILCILGLAILSWGGVVCKDVLQVHKAVGQLTQQLADPTKLLKGEVNYDIVYKDIDSLALNLARLDKDLAYAQPVKGLLKTIPGVAPYIIGIEGLLEMSQEFVAALKLTVEAFEAMTQGEDKATVEGKLSEAKRHLDRLAVVNETIQGAMPGLQFSYYQQLDFSAAWLNELVTISLIEPSISVAIANLGELYAELLSLSIRAEDGFPALWHKQGWEDYRRSVQQAVAYVEELRDKLLPAVAEPYLRDFKCRPFAVSLDLS